MLFVVTIFQPLNSPCVKRANIFINCIYIMYVIFTPFGTTL